MVTTKERLKAKKTYALLLVLVICVLLSILLLGRGCKEEGSIEIYADEGLQCPIGSFNEPGLFSEANSGWNNKSLWIRNNGQYPVQIDVHYVLPDCWRMGWDYSGRPVEPAEVRKVIIGVFAAYPIPADSLMLSLDFKYRVLDGE